MGSFGGGCGDRERVYFLGVRREDPPLKRVFGMASPAVISIGTTGSALSYIVSVYGVWLAVTAASGATPNKRRRLRRHHQLGAPVLDLAPRIDMLDRFPPKSYQLFAVADTVLALGMGPTIKIRSAAYPGSSACRTDSPVQTAKFASTWVSRA